MPSSASMEVRSFDSAGEFLEAALPFLAENEAEHNVLIGLAQRIAAGGTGGTRVEEEPPRFWLVCAGGRPAGAALVTPPYDLQLGLCAEGAAAALARRLDDEGRAPPGVSGPEAAADEFAGAWESLTGRAATLWRPERLYKLVRVTPPVGVPGAMRPGEADDLELVTRWLDAFARHAGEELDAEAAAAAGLESGRFFLWLDPDPVSLAGWTRPLVTGVAVAPVFTPPEQRGRGYATALTAALSQRLLDEGNAFCCLYTDRRDPAPNRVYERVGYRPLLDVSHLRFVS